MWVICKFATLGMKNVTFKVFFQDAISIRGRLKSLAARV